MNLDITPEEAAFVIEGPLEGLKILEEATCDTIKKLEAELQFHLRYRDALRQRIEEKTRGGTKPRNRAASELGNAILRGAAEKEDPQFGDFDTPEAHQFTNPGVERENYSRQGKKLKNHPQRHPRVKDTFGGGTILDPKKT